MENSNITTRILRVSETVPKFVGRSIAVIDPKAMEELQLAAGDILEISTSSKKKSSFVFLWSSQHTDYGRGLIRIDGYTRSNVGVGIDDKVTIKKVNNVKNAEWVVISATEELHIIDLEEYLPGLLEGRVVTNGDTIPLNVMGRKIDFVIN